MNRRRHLTAAALDDDDALGAWLDGVADVVPEVRAASRRIVRLQRRLHRRVDADAWKVYLLLEEATSARSILMLDAVVKPAFEDGRRWARRRRR